MNRREVIVAGTAAAVVQTVVTATGCKAEGGTTIAAAQPGGAPLGLADAIAACTTAGEICLTHCLRRLSKGDTSLGECARQVRDMLAVCAATETLALSGSSHLSQAASLCVAVCETCRAECERHSKHHAECRACEAACVGVIGAAREIAAS